MQIIGDQHREALTGLGRQFAVQRLELFGSAANGTFDPRRSDLDFLVVFEPNGSAGAADRYFGLMEGLEGLFGRPVDLVELGAVRNPYFLRGIEGSRRVLY